ncbi:MAG: ATPase domain-containing protein [Candidatus Thermoplasmatota archaeon]|nr:ATPase domain-containing protein [Candidatus Thermoplasmatota archaeon]
MKDIKRCKTGIYGLDRLLEGGIPEKRIVIISGGPGSGKTTLGVQFLRTGAMRGETGVYLSIMEDPRMVVQDQSKYDSNLTKYYREKKLVFIDAGPLTWGELMVMGEDDEGEDSKKLLSPSHLLQRISPIIEEMNVKRLIIDSSMALKYDYNEGVARKELSRFIRTLKTFDCTTILLSELTDPTAYAAEHFAAQGVIFLHHFMHERSMIRALQIIKMRGTKHDNQLHPMSFNDEGLAVEEGGLRFE